MSTDVTTNATAFHLRRPCATCPFRRAVVYMQRFSIENNLCMFAAGQVPHCHYTVKRGEGGCASKDYSGPREACAGAAVMLKKSLSVIPHPQPAWLRLSPASVEECGHLVYDDLVDFARNSQIKGNERAGWEAWDRAESSAAADPPPPRPLPQITVDELWKKHFGKDGFLSLR